MYLAFSAFLLDSSFLDDVIFIAGIFFPSVGCYVLPFVSFRNF